MLPLQMYQSFLAFTIDNLYQTFVYNICKGKTSVNCPGVFGIYPRKHLSSYLEFTFDNLCKVLKIHYIKHDTYP